MNDDRGPVEEHARDIVWMRGKGRARKDAVEDQARVWQRTRLNGHGDDAARVGRVGCAEVGEQDVLDDSLVTNHRD